MGTASTLLGVQHQITQTPFALKQALSTMFRPIVIDDECSTVPAAHSATKCNASIQTVLQSMSSELGIQPVAATKGPAVPLDALGPDPPLNAVDGGTDGVDGDVVMDRVDGGSAVNESTDSGPRSMAEAVSARAVVSDCFERGNDGDFKAMNAIWKRVDESLSRCSLPAENESVSAVIRQRLFLFLCSEYLRIRSHPQRVRDVDTAEFLKCGGVALDSLCKIKAAHSESFGEMMRRRIHEEYDRKIERVRAERGKLTKNRYQYVYNPPQSRRMPAH